MQPSAQWPFVKSFEDSNFHQKFQSCPFPVRRTMKDFFLHCAAAMVTFIISISLLGIEVGGTGKTHIWPR